MRKKIGIQTQLRDTTIDYLKNTALQILANIKRIYMQCVGEQKRRYFLEKGISSVGTNVVKIEKIFPAGRYIFSYSPYMPKLKYQVNFAYKEHGERRNALVKLRLCPKCADKLNYHTKKRLINPKTGSSYLFILYFLIEWRTDSTKNFDFNFFVHKISNLQIHSCFMFVYVPKVN